MKSPIEISEEISVDDCTRIVTWLEKTGCDCPPMEPPCDGTCITATVERLYKAALKKRDPQNYARKPR